MDWLKDMMVDNMDKYFGDVYSFEPNEKENTLQDIENYKNDMETKCKYLPCMKTLHINISKTDAFYCIDIDDYSNEVKLIGNNSYELPTDITHLQVTDLWYDRFNFNVLDSTSLVYLSIVGNQQRCDDKLFINKINRFPPNLLYLHIGVYYNNELDNLPFGLRYLKIGEHYNQPLDNLPATLEVLEFDRPSTFNQPLDKLPMGLKRLYFDRYSEFNQPLDNLPNSLEEITFYLDCEFSHPLLNLPNSLKRLRIDNYDYNHYINVYYLDKLEILECSLMINKKQDYEQVKLPKHLEQCRFRINIEYISKVEYKDVKEYFKLTYPNVKFNFW